MTCARCMVARYCNRECQKGAWEHHHKDECKAFVAFKDYEQKILAGGSLVTNGTFRLPVRILVLFKNNKIPESEWAELMASATARVQKDQRPEIKSSFKWMAKLLEKHIGMDLPRSTLRSIISTVRRNYSEICVPFLKGQSRSCEALIPTTFTEVGIYLDPFVCGIKDSCEANAWVVFEGNELRVRALKSILAGTELSISWSRGSLADWDAHRAILAENIDLDCKCVVCENGIPGLGSELTERLKKYDDG
ncbi:hypothetical protein BDZ45DRAFT_351133 [Acephala macrosclerotiorum]|nr:hypothetical protein BDZ45DRAFT_351133 [Acephala macrosclerotiorum]